MRTWVAVFPWVSSKSRRVFYHVKHAGYNKESSWLEGRNSHARIPELTAMGLSVVRMKMSEMLLHFHTFHRS
jgi:hypothetical protein